MTGRLVAFCGLAGSGKTTAADALVAEGWVRVKFADPLKAMLRAYYKAISLTDDEIEDRIEGPLKGRPDIYLGDRTPRHAMQTLGTEWGRDLIHTDLWTRAWAARTRALLLTGKNVVCDDIRFPNEAEQVREMGGTICYIARPDVARASDHPSEALHLDHDTCLVNDQRFKTFQRIIAMTFRTTP